jgi:hypothetical protein
VWQNGNRVRARADTESGCVRGARREAGAFAGRHGKWVRSRGEMEAGACVRRVLVRVEGAGAGRGGKRVYAQSAGAGRHGKWLREWAANLVRARLHVARASQFTRGLYDHTTAGGSRAHRTGATTHGICAHLAADGDAGEGQHLVRAHARHGGRQVVDQQVHGVLLVDAPLERVHLCLRQLDRGAQLLARLVHLHRQLPWEGRRVVGG